MSCFIALATTVISIASANVLPITKIGNNELNAVLSDNVLVGFIVANAIQIIFFLAKSILEAKQKHEDHTSEKLDNTVVQLESLSKSVNKIEVRLETLLERDEISKDDIIRSLDPHIRLAVMEALDRRNRQ